MTDRDGARAVPIAFIGQLCGGLGRIETMNFRKKRIG